MKYIIICGPTCSGKTRLGISLAKNVDGEIVNADSRQIYKLTDIGTAKPTPAEMKEVKHHLFDFLSLEENFSAFQYAEKVRPVIADISSRGKLPIVVGGTGLYIKALTEGIFKSPGSDDDYRRTLEQEAENEGINKLHHMLTAVDPEAAQKIKPNDKVRLVRALEIYRQTGLPISKLQKSGEYLPSLGEPLWIGLTYKRKVLYERINYRVDKMIEMGFEMEVKKLEPFLDSMRKKKMIGYTDMIACLFDGKISRREAIEKIKQHHRNYAKRQLTWFRRVKQIIWFDPSDEYAEDNIIDLSLKYIKNT